MSQKVDLIKFIKVLKMDMYTLIVLYACTILHNSNRKHIKLLYILYKTWKVQ